MFEVIFYTIFTLGWGFFGYTAIHSTFYENNAYAECENIVYSTKDPDKSIEGIYSYTASAWDANYRQLLKATFKICIGKKCITKEEETLLQPHAYFESKKTSLIMDFPNLKRGNYTYTVTTDIEGYRVSHAEKTCFVTIF